jgi:2-oxoglutarate dehydrogenase E2 component (dihydrolipoamide succinyltransferase)
MSIVEVKVPELSESVAEATMLTWKKKAGEAVAVDEILIEIETDKGHDAIFLEEPALDSALRGFLASAAEKRGLS